MVSLKAAARPLDCLTLQIVNFRLIPVKPFGRFLLPSVNPATHSNLPKPLDSVIIIPTR